jgi:hypothetical protein
MVHTLMNELTDWRGDDERNDDVTIVALEVAQRPAHQ